MTQFPRDYAPEQKNDCKTHHLTFLTYFNGRSQRNRRII